MADLSSAVAQMRATLALTDPDLDTSTGTTTRKILDVVGEAIAEAGVDTHLITYQYDVDTKTDADLDDFCALFGIVRYGARRATGTVIFSRGSGNLSAPLFIPVGTQIATATVPSQLVVTIVPAFMDVNVRSVTVPVQAALGGVSGNIGAGLLTRLTSPITGITDATNISPLTGGTPQESDTALRARWRQTAFRNLAGTEQMYRGIAGDDPDCFKANVIGASKRHREQVQIQSGTATSVLDGAAYIYPGSSVMGPNIDAGQVLLRDHDYAFDYTTTPPSVVVTGTTYTDVAGTEIPFEGAIFDLDFEYQPKASRNDPANGISNRIDVICAGQRPVAATQSVIFSANKRFSSSPLDLYSAPRFVRLDDTNPMPNNVFIPLAFGPIITIPETLSVAGTTYHQGTDYFLVHEDSAFGYSPQSLFGLEWVQTNLPPGGAIFTMGDNGDYNYNDVPLSVQRNIERWRLIGTDAKVHQAKQIGLRFNLAVVYAGGFAQDQVNDAIRTACAQLLSIQDFGTVLQVSDILQFVHNVPGVDNVRFLNGADQGDHSGIERVVLGQVVGDFNSGTGRAQDIPFADNEIPVFDSISNGFATVLVPAIKAQNSFGTAG